MAGSDGLGVRRGMGEGWMRELEEVRRVKGVVVIGEERSE